MKFLSAISLFCVASCIALFAFAASTNNTISWTNATTYIDNTTPFTSLCCTNIYRATNSAGTDSAFLTQVKGAMTSYVDVVTAPGTYCYATQTVSSKAGDLGSVTSSPYVCKTIAAPPPATVTTPRPPTNVAVK